MLIFTKKNGSYVSTHKDSDIFIIKTVINDSDRWVIKNFYYETNQSFKTLKDAKKFVNDNLSLFEKKDQPDPPDLADLADNDFFEFLLPIETELKTPPPTIEFKKASFRKIQPSPKKEKTADRIELDNRDRIVSCFINGYSFLGNVKLDGTIADYPATFLLKNLMRILIELRSRYDTEHNKITYGDRTKGLSGIFDCSFDVFSLLNDNKKKLDIAITSKIEGSTEKRKNQTTDKGLSFPEKTEGIEENKNYCLARGGDPITSSWLDYKNISRIQINGVAVYRDKLDIAKAGQDKDKDIERMITLKILREDRIKRNKELFDLFDCGIKTAPIAVKIPITSNLIPENTHDRNVAALFSINKNVVYCSIFNEIVVIGNITYCHSDQYVWENTTQFDVASILNNKPLSDSELSDLMIGLKDFYGTDQYKIDSKLCYIGDRVLAVKKKTGSVLIPVFSFNKSLDFTTDPDVATKYGFLKNYSRLIMNKISLLTNLLTDQEKITRDHDKKLLQDLRKIFSIHYDQPMSSDRVIRMSDRFLHELKLIVCNDHEIKKIILDKKKNIDPTRFNFLFNQFINAHKNKKR